MTLRELLKEVGIKIDIPTKERPLSIDLYDLNPDLLDKEIIIPSNSFFTGARDVSSVSYEEEDDCWFIT